MSLKVKISHEQLQNGRVIANGWYQGVITNVEEDTDKNGTPMITLELKVEGHPNYTGVPVRSWLCQEWPGGGDFMRRFLEALTGKPYQQDQEIDLSAAKNRKIKFYNKQGDYNGRPTNRIEDWANIDKAV